MASCNIGLLPFSSPQRHLKEMEEDDWNLLVEEFLEDSWFSPFEIATLHSMAITTAKGLVASTIIPV